MQTDKIPQDTQKLLKQYFGYSEFRPLQEEIINDALEKKDTFVLMPTGGGKSICYQIPALMMSGTCIVISPLISLMKDQVDGLVQNGVNAEYLNSTITEKKQAEIIETVKAGIIDILYIAPERLLQPAFFNLLQTIDISLFAIDESHCVSEWGHDFRPDYMKLDRIRENFPETPIMALTATATERVKEDIILSLKLKDSTSYQASFDRGNLSYEIRPQKDAYSQLLGYLEKDKKRSGIIYCLSRKGVENLAIDLKDEGYNALPYHAGLTSKKRSENQEKFIRDDVDIIVATVAFGMGIDKPDVRFVVHYNLPSSLERYYQETGRAGRDGLPSECILFFGYGDKSKIQFFINQKKSQKEKDVGYAQLRSILDYSESNICRRKVLLNYFGEEYKTKNCKNCDNCLNPKERINGTEITQKIISCVYRVNQRFGVGYVAKVLVGSREKKILENRHDVLTTYDIMDDYSADEVIDFIREVIQMGLLQLSEDQYSILKLTPASTAFLKNSYEIELIKPSKPQTISSEGIETEYEKVLFENLKRLRKVIADKLEIPPYQVFNDKTLQEICIYFPQSEDSFLKIVGVGEKKLESFGEEFLEIIIAYCKHNNLAEVTKTAPRHNTSTGSVSKQKSKKLTKSSSSIKTYDFYKSGMNAEEIASERDMSPRTIYSHLAEAIESGKKVDLNDFSSKENQEEILKAIEEVGPDLLSPIKKVVDDQITFEEIKIVTAHYKSGNSQ